MKHAPAGIGLRLGAGPHGHGLRHGLAVLPKEAVRIGHHKPGFIRRIRFQIQNAARKHVGRDDVKHTLVLVDPFALQTQQWQPLLPLRLALFAVRHIYLRVAIVVALNEPFKAKVDQRGMVDDELTRLDFVPILRRAGAAQKEHRKDKSLTTSLYSSLQPSYAELVVMTDLAGCFF